MVFLVIFVALDRCNAKQVITKCARILCESGATQVDTQDDPRMTFHVVADFGQDSARMMPAWKPNILLKKKNMFAEGRSSWVGRMIPLKPA